MGDRRGVQKRTLSRDHGTQDNDQRSEPAREPMAAGGTASLGGRCLAAVARPRGSVPFTFSCSVKPFPGPSQGELREAGDKQHWAHPAVWRRFKSFSSLSRFHSRLGSWGEGLAETVAD